MGSACIFLIRAVWTLFQLKQSLIFWKLRCFETVKRWLKKKPQRAKVLSTPQLSFSKIFSQNNFVLNLLLNIFSHLHHCGKLTFSSKKYLQIYPSKVSPQILSLNCKLETMFFFVLFQKCFSNWWSVWYVSTCTSFNNLYWWNTKEAEFRRTFNFFHIFMTIRSPSAIVSWNFAIILDEDCCNSQTKTNVWSS